MTLWRACIKLRNGETFEVFSAIEIRARMLVETGWLLISGEHDTRAFPLSDVAHFHIYEQGACVP